MPGQSARENGKLGGRPKGTTGIKHKSTISKELAREALRAVIQREFEAMTQAQIAQAKGIKYLVTRDKRTGKFIRVGPAMAAHVNEDTVEVWEKDPSTPAYTDLANRYVDKPKEQPQDFNVTATVRIADILRERHAKHSKCG